MRRSRLAAALTVLPLAVSSLAFTQSGDDCRSVDPDGAAASGDEYELCTEVGYVTGTATKAGNLSNVDSSAQAYASWDETEPTTSFSSGGGSGYANAAAPALAESPVAQAVYEGTFSGALDAIEFDLFLLYAPEGVYQPDDINIQLEVRPAGGEYVTLLPMSGQFDVDVEYLGGSTNALWRQDFALTGIRNALGFFGLQDETDLELRVTIEPNFVNSGNWVYVHDATEVPSALTFNPELVFVPTLSVG